jgi:dTDP-4-amino-4,6-dideoxygalactose transaminase
VIGSGFVGYGETARTFEKELCAITGAEAGVALATGSIALAMALHAVGVRMADLVITTGLGCLATIGAIESVGAQSVIVDVDWSSQVMAPKSLSEALSSRRVAAVVVVQFAGNSGPITQLRDIVGEHGIPLIVDACHHLGHGLATGSSAGSTVPDVLTVYSFSATKVITTGEGGMVVGPRLYVDAIRRSASGRSQGPAEGDGSPQLRLKLVMSDVAASLGRAQLEALAEMVATRRALAQRYDAAIEGSDIVRPLPRDPESNVHYYLVETLQRDLVQRQLWSAGVQAISIEGHATIKHEAGLAISRRLLSCALALPLYPALSAQQVEIVETSIELVGGKR